MLANLIKSMPKKIAVATICYNEMTPKYLPSFLSSLKAQAFRDFDLFVADNSDTKENPNSSFILKEFPDAKCIWMGGNLGFGKAYNRLIDILAEQNYEYIFVVNPDTIFETDCLAQLLQAIETDKNLSSVCPKIYSWNFAENKKTDILDSCGIVMTSPLLFSDQGQGKKDSEFIPSDIIGPSGAAGLFRIKHLLKIKDEHGYYDERMFMYKEDCDLAYRLYRRAYPSLLVGSAIVYHDRSVAKSWQGFWGRLQARQKRSRLVRGWSFVNQQLLFAKHWSGLKIKEKLALVFYQVKLLPYVILFEPFLLFELIKAKKRGIFKMNQV
jgi:GT2 family glycosyltransferase